METFNEWKLVYPQNIGKMFTSGNHELLFLIENQIVARLGVFDEQIIVFHAIRKVDIDHKKKVIEFG